MKRLVIIVAMFLTVQTKCHWGDSVNINSPYPSCWELTTEFETKEALVSFLKLQDKNLFPYIKVYEAKPLGYDLIVETEKHTHQEEVTETVETKREIKFK